MSRKIIISHHIFKKKFIQKSTLALEISMLIININKNVLEFIYIYPLLISFLKK